MIDVVVSYLLNNKQKESVVAFGLYTYKIITDNFGSVFAEKLDCLPDQRSKEEWHEYFYDYAIKRCWDVWFEWGFIPKDLKPRRFIPASSIISATFPDGWILYRDAKQEGAPFPLYTAKEFLERITEDC